MSILIMPLLVAAVIAIIVGVVAWQHRRVDGARAMALLMVTMAAWALGYGEELASPDFPTKFFWDRLIPLTYALVPVLTFIMVVQFIGEKQRLTRRRQAALFVIPVITEVVALTNGLNGAWLRNVQMVVAGGLPYIDGDMGPWFWVHAGYGYLLVALSIVLLLRPLRDASPLYRGQLLSLLTSLVVPAVANMVFVAGFQPLGHYDPTPVAFCVSGVVMAIGLFRYRLFDILPVAQATIIESLGDGVLVLDAQERLVDLNPAAQGVLGQAASAVVGHPAADVLRAWPALLDFCRSAARQAEVAREAGTGVRYYELRGSPLPGRQGQALGRVITLHDISVRKRAEQELRRRNEELASLNAVTQAVATVQDLPATLLAASREMTRIFRAVRCGMALLNGARTALTVVADFSTAPDEPNGVGLVLPLAGNPASVTVVETARTLVIPDAQTNPLTESIHAMLRARRVECLMVAPLLARGEVIGTIGVDLDEPGRTFTPAEVALMETMAGQLASAIENARLFSETQRRVADLATLTDIGRALSATLRMPDLLQLIYEQTGRLMYAEHMAVGLYDPGRHEVEFVFSRAREPEIATGRRVSADLGLTGRVLRERRTIMVREEGAAADRSATAELAGLPTAAWLGVPMLAADPQAEQPDRVLGIIFVQHYTDPHAYDATHRALLEAVASQAAVALENARLFGETQRRVTELATLAEIGQALSAALDRPRLLEVIARQTARVMYAENLFVALYHPEVDELEYVLDVRPDHPRTGRRRQAARGLTEYVVRTRQPLCLIGNLAEQMRQREIEPIGSPSAAWLGVPVLVGDRVLGVLSVQHYTDPWAYDAGHADLLQSIANQFAIALENARLYGEAQRRVVELKALADIGRATSSTLDLDTLLKVFYSEIGKVMEAANFVVALYDPDTDLLSKPINYDRGVAYPPNPVPLGNGLTSLVIQQRRSLLIRDVEHDALPAEPLTTASGQRARAWLGVPLVFGPEVLGAVIIESYAPQAYGEEDRRFLEAAADQAAVAIKNARLYAETRWRADEAASLNRVGVLLASTLEMDEILDAIYREARQLLDLTAFSVALYDEAQDEFRFELFANRGEMLPKFNSPRANSPLNAWVLQHQNSMLLRDADKEIHPAFILVGKPGAQWMPKSFLGVPLVYKSRAIGVMVAQSEERLAFGAHQQQVMEGIAHLAAPALENARLLRELQTIAAENARLYQEAQREKQYFESLVLNSPVAIVVTDLDSQVTGWNPYAEKLFGYTQTEAVGRPIDQLVTAEADRAEALTYNQRVRHGEVAHGFTQRCRKDGSLVAVELLGVPVSIAGRHVGQLVIYHDITELQRARQAAEAANRAKSEFLANMSHEIRTPMNAIIGMTDLLLDTTLTARQREFAATVRESSDALLMIINDILDFSKIEAGKLDLEQQPFDLRECLDAALDVVAGRAMEKGLDLACLVEAHVPSILIGDSGRLRQILINLLSNAVKFTDQGEVVLSVSAEAESQPPAKRPGHSKLEALLLPVAYLLHVTVRDTGVGIPPDQVGRLFRSFSQLDTSTTRKYGGTGLGLAISKRLVEMMGGQIWVESEGQPGQGSVFHITFSARAATRALPVYLSGDQPSLRGKRVLVVDDNATNRRLVTLQTESWGMVPEAAASGPEALARLQRGEAYDVALLDMQMPEMDGLQLAEAIRRYRDADALPLVMLTSLGREMTDERAVAFAAFLTKPIKASQLYNTLMGVLAEETHPPTHRAALVPESNALDARMAERWPLQILLAEDNLTNRKLALFVLERLGYQPAVALTGLEVLAALQAQPYEVVLMDVQMPELDGLEATRRIRATFPAARQPYIIAMTANAMRGDRETCLAAGMNDYLSKPIRLEDVVAALRRSRSEPAASAVEAAAEAAPAALELDPAALTLLRQLGEGDPTFVEEMIGTFLEDAPRLLAGMRKALAEGDAPALRLCAHSLKSNSANFGASELAALCRELENAAKAGRLDDAPARVAEIEQAYGRVRGALEALQRGPASP